MSSPRIEQLGKLLNLPDSAVPVVLVSVGYPAESWEAGGQTRKAPYGSLFSEMQYGDPFELSPEVEEELKQEKLIQEQAPLPWREAELQFIQRAYSLDQQIISMPKT